LFIHIILKSSIGSLSSTSTRLSATPSIVHRLISRRRTAVGDFADFQSVSDKHT
jgi:hypothetical protein